MTQWRDFLRSTNCIQFLTATEAVDSNVESCDTVYTYPLGRVSVSLCVSKLQLRACYTEMDEAEL
jgi:hypothetical protein